MASTTNPDATTPPVVEDYRSDRAILEEIAAELGRLHRRLDEYEGHVTDRFGWVRGLRFRGGHRA